MAGKNQPGSPPAGPANPNQGGSGNSTNSASRQAGSEGRASSSGRPRRNSEKGWIRVKGRRGARGGGAGGQQQQRENSQGRPPAATHQDPGAAGGSGEFRRENSRDAVFPAKKRKRRQRNRRRNEIQSGGDSARSTSGGGGDGVVIGKPLSEWTSSDEEEERLKNERNPGGLKKVPPTIDPVVRCVDPSGVLALRSLKDIITEGSQLNITTEADTPLLGPSDQPSFKPAEAPPAFPFMMPPAMGAATGSMEELTAAMGNPVQSNDSLCTALMNAGQFTHDAITTPNTLRALTNPTLPPSFSDVFLRDLLDSFTPPPPFPPSAEPVSMNDPNFVGKFSWPELPESRQNFVTNIISLCDQLIPVLKGESMMPTIQAPAYIFGDIHGNFADLSYFMRSVLPFGDIHLSPCHILCLGDYVDRGPFSLECVALLFALKLEEPSKVTLLRGNHEDRIVCGDRRTYGSECFLAQCQAVLGPVDGMKVFRATTLVFKYLPLATEIVSRRPNNSSHHQRILCTHGGIPRFFGDPKQDDMLEFLRSPDFPRLLTLFPNNPMAKQFPEDSELDQPVDDAIMEKAWYAMFDFMWSDPTPVEHESPGQGNINEWGFGTNSRGNNVVTFSAKAVETFLHSHQYAMLIRAHQEKAHGIRLSKSQKVLTVFSSSNYLGHGNGAGCVVVARTGQVQLIVKTS